ncbi:SDR family oxidoreductase [Spirochaeta dissipatitropha]
MSFATGKKIIITGANSGIGFETARKLAAFGAEVIMVCRSQERGKAALDAIQSEDPDADLTLLLADLSSKRSTEELIANLHGAYKSIDILINNAGAMIYDRRTSEDGIEYTFALNHLGPFRLSTGIMDLLKKAPEARIINVSSDAHRFSKIEKPEDLRALLNPLRYRGFPVYCNSKLANILFTRELARRTKGSNVSTAALHPGFIRTNFGGIQNKKKFSALVFQTIAALFAGSPERGAATSVHLADTDKISSGLYYAREKPVIPSRASRNDILAAELWKISEELC